MGTILRVQYKQIILEAEIIEMGNDLLIAVSGGTHPHIGSVSASIPRPSLTDPSRTSSTTSTINMIGHKDNEVGDKIAARLSTELKTHVVVVCGIHIDNLNSEQIEKIVDLAKELTENIISEKSKEFH
jgi:hypothetical protein